MPSVKDWSEFIDARISQEKGVLGTEKSGDENALTSLDRLCAAYPNNSAFLKAKAWSLSVLNREEDAVSSLIESSYAELAHRLSGKNDVAENWISELQKLKTTIAAIDKTRVCTSFMAW
jgi:hypothetical protein